jgi:hypothetical protein
MPEIRDVGASAKINFLLHTDIGWGKTTLIGSGGHEYKTLIMRPPIDHVDPIIGSGCKEMVVRNWEETFEGLEQIRHEGHEWDWFWIDSISLLQDIGLDDVYEGILDKRGPVGSPERKAREQFGPDKGEYRVNMWRLGQFVRHVVGAGVVNLGITAHSFWYEPKQGSVDEETVEPSLYPWIQGKAMPSKFCGMMNIVGYGNLRTRKRGTREITERVIHTNKTERYYAKCQYKLPDGGNVFGPDGVIVNPTMPKIMEAINKGRIVRPSGRRRTVRRPTRGS